MTGLEHHNLGTGAGFPARFAMGGGQVSQGLIGRVARALPAIFAATMMCAAAFLAATSTADACSIAAPTCVSAINGLESERVDLGLESQNASIFVEALFGRLPLAQGASSRYSRWCRLSNAGSRSVD